MSNVLDNFHTERVYNTLEWGWNGVILVWEDAPGGQIEIEITLDIVDDGRVMFETAVTQGDVTYTMCDDAVAIEKMLPGAVWPYALASGRGLKTHAAHVTPSNSIESNLDVFALTEKQRIFVEIACKIRDVARLLVENESALSDGLNSKLPIDSIWHLHDVCKDIVQSDARGWEGYHLSNATKAIWRVLDIFDDLDESDKEALGDGFLDDLHTYLTLLEQIANGDYFVN